MSEDVAIPIVTHSRPGGTAAAHGSWYRGQQPHFIPSKLELAAADAADKYILDGWLPPRPFITKSSPITAIGSCFAENISDHLIANGYNVFGKDLHRDSAHIIRFGEGLVNTFSIRQQFEWALANREFPERLWVGPNREIASLDPAIRAETHRIMNATSVFIITLGLSEIWYDKRSGEAFWRAIPSHLFDDNLHGFRLSSVQENADNLAAIRSLIRAYKPDATIIFTLSPIPLVATFRPISCLTANSVSKAILRVAVDQTMRDHADDRNLFYFPSYEIVHELFPDHRLEDNRHVKPEIVAFIMQRFTKHYCI